MLRTIPLSILVLAVPLFVFAQHSGGGSSGGSSSGSSSGGGSHASGGSSGGSAGGAGGGSHSSSGSSAPSHGGGASHAGSGRAPSSSPHSGSAPHGMNARNVPAEANKPPLRNPGQPVKVTKHPTLPHHLFAFLAPHRKGNPPCRGKNCPSGCSQGLVMTKSGCARSENVVWCSTYDGSGACAAANTTCSGPSPSVMQAQMAEVDRLRTQRELACSQDLRSQSCRDLMQWYVASIQRLDMLRAQATNCR